MSDFSHPSNRTLLFLALLLVCGFGLVGNMDYQDAKLIEAEKRMGAPIYSKKCERQGKSFIAKQADGGKWVVVCLNDGVRI